MSEYMENHIDDLIQSGIELRDSIDQFLYYQGWKPPCKIPYEKVVELIGRFLNE